MRARHNDAGGARARKSLLETSFTDRSLEKADAEAREAAAPHTRPNMLPLLTVATAGTCPDLSSSTVSLNLTEWVRASWFVQEQQVAPYQAVSRLHTLDTATSLQPQPILL